MSQRHRELQALYAKHHRLLDEQAALQQRDTHIRARLHSIEEAINLMSSDQVLQLLPERKYHIAIADLVSHRSWFWGIWGLLAGLLVGAMATLSLAG